MKLDNFFHFEYSDNIDEDNSLNTVNDKNYKNLIKNE